MITISELERAFRLVRQELYQLGLLADGIYLDRIDLARSPLPTLRVQGFAYDQDVGFWSRVLGLRQGTIYIPINARVLLRTPGSTLVDVVRHEFAHAWAWLDRRFIAGRWFCATFGAGYDSITDGTRKIAWHALQMRLRFRCSPFWRHYVSPYAMVRSAEDFAETFMFYLRCRRTLTRFANRPGVYRKFRAVERAVHRKRRQLGS